MHERLEINIRNMFDMYGYDTEGLASENPSYF